MKKTITTFLFILSFVGFAQELHIGDSDLLHIYNNTVFYVDGSATGNANYHRTFNDTNWHLIASPLTGQVFNNDYITANGIASGQDNNRGIAMHVPSTNTWAYYQAGAADETFVTGIGYSIKRSVAGDVSFNGTLNTTDVSPTVNADKWNLLGNPFLSYMNTVDFLTDIQNDLLHIDLYVWNQSTNTYDVKNFTEQIVLSPAQGFFVRTKPGVTSLTMKKDYKRETGDEFRKTSQTVINLTISDGSNTRVAKVYYLENNATTGFDNGYDGESFGGIVNANSFDVFTHLVTNDIGKNYQIQALPRSDFETIVVPVGVTAEADKEITFTALTTNLSEGLKVFLEDKLTNTFTRLDEENASYKVVLNQDTNGVGRFYLHTKTSGVLSSDDVDLANVSIYKTDNTTLRVSGLFNVKANLKMYNLLGKQVFETNFNASGVDDIKLQKVAAGMYIIRIESENNQINKKIILE